ncbi:hypothetical protein [Clostridium magnum]|uniref:Uncharacterized protein n=1 Tax=Clostridium magnum DSM 2767 TaxID=1121326 RepID=A0A168E288_9CLOT|nr:hypothetical protein [Clostridium magnum]KZL93581.1 hypothetical protein CLMAG_06270 [Clostridium magnum DSM 2767]SHI59384.1 hypothetical protein SAMN02745944_04549 [Clostridium magnum DSM 2767]
MAISNNSARVQFTLNKSKDKEKIIAKFLEEFINPNNAIKEILYNYIVSNSDTKLLKVTHSEVTQSDTKLLEVSKSELLDDNIVTQGEVKLPEVSDLEQNELEELSKFI